uniref:Putative secreted protein n=1 Tax=Amblyomma triste TaxID=251400 RepID=A0A023G361_AMBTT
MGNSALVMLLLATVSASSAVNDYSRRVKFPCASDVDYTESINDYLRKMPNNISAPPYPSKEIMGFRISRPTLTGLGSLWAYRPYNTFCVDNQTFIETTVFADEPLTLSVNWKSCTGSRGRLGTKIAAEKLRLYFVSKTTPEEPTRVVLYNIAGESLEEARLFIDDAPSALRGFVDVISVVAMPHIELFWRRFIRVDVLHFLNIWKSI